MFLTRSERLRRVRVFEGKFFNVLRHHSELRRLLRRGLSRAAIRRHRHKNSFAPTAVRGGWLTYGPYGNKDGIVLHRARFPRGHSVRLSRGKHFGAVSQRGFLLRRWSGSDGSGILCHCSGASSTTSSLSRGAEKASRPVAASRRSGGTSRSSASRSVINPGIKSRIPASRIGPTALSVRNAAKFPLPTATRTR